ncbi:MAG: GNAT family N-acetyltransferase [Hyphomicrobiaceae bacterium]|nr:GNAT family N-acetyltransferase [Hyphomicrobiaceae bacterium]
MPDLTSPSGEKPVVVICPFLALPTAVRRATVAAIDAIFFEASSVKAFADNEARAAFRWLWLGRYLCEEPEHAFVAQTGDGRTIGYLVGSIADPAQREAFASLTYFADFARLTAQYPAHLHINMAAGSRSTGVGARLIEAFAEHAKERGAPGMHVVTSADARNTRFYRRCGFVERARADRPGGAVVLLCRALSADL